MPHQKTEGFAEVFCQNPYLEAFFLRNLRYEDNPHSNLPLFSYEMKVLVATLGWQAQNGRWSETGLKTAEDQIRGFEPRIRQAAAWSSSPLQGYLDNVAEADLQRREILERWLDDLDENLDKFVKENGGSQNWSSTLQRRTFLQVILVALVVNGLLKDFCFQCVVGGNNRKHECRPDIRLLY